MDWKTRAEQLLKKNENQMIEIEQLRNKNARLIASCDHIYSILSIKDLNDPGDVTTDEWQWLQDYVKERNSLIPDTSDYT